MPGEAIGNVPHIELHVHKGETTTFDFEWWADKAATVPVNLVSGSGKVLGNSTETEPYLVFDAYASVVGNVCTVNVPPEVTAALETLDRGVWSFFLTADTGQVKKVARGQAWIHQ